MNLRNVNWTSAFLASALLAAGSLPAAAGVLWDQPWDLSANLRASQNDTNIGGNGHFATTYDNFQLSASSNITEIDWTGGYFSPGTQGPITQFTIQFYNAGLPGVPGTALGSPTVIAGTANETFLTNAQGFPIYTYSAATSFAATAGTEYWVSIVPDLGYPPQWGWAAGTGGDGAAYQVFFGAGNPVGNDMAFTLKGNSGTPEPVSFSLAGIGLGLVGLVSWKRRKHAA